MESKSLILLALYLLVSVVVAFEYDSDTFDRNEAQFLADLEERMEQSARKAMETMNLPMTDVCLLRQWVWTDWDNGPKCPMRDQYQFNAIDLESTVMKEAIALLDLQINVYLSELHSVGAYPAVYVSSLYNDQVIFSQGFGSLTPHGDDTPPTEDTVFNIGSVTKVFTSLAFMSAIDEGLVSLDEPVTSFFNEGHPPAFDVKNPYSGAGAEAVTLHSLSTQSSGLPREPACGIFPLVSLDARCANGTEAETNFNYLSQFPLVYPPFTKSTYSNLGLSLLGRCLERRWNGTYEQEMDNTILPAMNMTSSGFVYTPQVLDKMATGFVLVSNGKGGYYQVPGKYSVGECNDNGTCESAMQWAAPCGAMYTNTVDLQQFFKMIFKEGDGPLMSQTALNEFLLPGAYLPDGISTYGLGTWEVAYAGCYWTLTKGGLVDGFSASIVIVPELKLAVSVLVNINSGSTTASLSALTTLILRPAVIQAIQDAQVAHPLPPNYTTLFGNYGNQIVLEAGDAEDQGVLSGLVFGQPQFFIYAADLSDSQVTAFRYMYSGNSLSCLSETAIDSFGIVLFTVDGSTGKPLATLVNENLGSYNIKRIP